MYTPVFGRRIVDLENETQISVSRKRVKNERNNYGSLSSFYED
jgi:hypothetical protein